MIILGFAKIPEAGKIYRGLACEKVEEDMRRISAYSRQPVEDTINRREILEKIKEALDNGVDLETITKELSEDELVKEKFDYLIKHGIDLKTVFANWYKSYKENKEKNLNMELSSIRWYCEYRYNKRKGIK